MRYASSVLVLAALLYLAAPAHAQLRADLPQTGAAPVAVYQAPTGFSLGSLVNPEHFKISNSYEMSFSSFGGQSLGLGVLTTSLRFQPTNRLAARVDVGVAHSPFGSDGLQQQLGFGQDTPARVFIRNAQIAYRPTENSLIQFQVQQSPFGGYASPYGYYSPYGGTQVRAGFGASDYNDLFWRTAPR
ncbi:MAG: hypothetical protein AAGI91_11560 [Bacteroidota bacterium]